MARIKNDAYNRAKTMLTVAGSASASKSHTKHGKPDDCPAEHGVALLREARDEFRVTDAGGQGLRAGMTAGHYQAVHSAANEMGISGW